MEKKVICYIQAFDCEHTIEAAMQSVLDQTYGNWLCFVLSNGNGGNGTFDVIKNFSLRDSRFIVLNKARNDVSIYIPMLYYLASRFPNSYICSLDADDVYQKNFFERAVTLAEEKQLDIVACGTEIVLKKNVEAEEEILLSRRALDEDLIVRKKDFTRQFCVYKPFFNEMWGKMYHSRLFDARHNEAYARKRFFFHFLPDTLFTIDNLSRSHAIGILSGTAHKFYQFEQRPTSNATFMSNAYVANQQPKRYANWKTRQKQTFSVYATYQTIMAFLNAHGEIDRELYEYMQAVLFGWFGDFYARTLLLTTDEAKFVGHVEHLVFHPKFSKLMSYQDTGKYDNLRDFVKRKEFCERLKYQLIGQEAIKNRLLQGEDTYCDAKTKQKIAEIIKKLDDVTDMISHKQQARGANKC